MSGERHSPRVSVGLPVFNGERYLSHALDSILAQTYEGFELVISDNASTDGTEEICRAYAERDERVRYFRNTENLGAAANFNRTFELSTREYFKWVAADDVLAPEFLERCVEALDDHPEAVLAYPRVRCIDDRGRLFLDDQPEEQAHVLWRPTAVDRFRQLLDDSPWRVFFVFGLIRAEQLARTRLIGGYMGSDCTLVAELALLGPFHEVPQRLSFIRLHGESSTFQSTDGIVSFFDPRIRGRLALRAAKQRRYFEYFVSILRSPLGLGDKLALVAHNAARPLRRLRGRAASPEGAREEAAERKAA